MVEAEQIGFVPLLAEAKLVLAGTLDNDPAGAEAAGREAVEAAASIGDDRVLRDALRRLVFDIGVRRGRVPEAEGIALAARAAWLRSGLDPDADASLQANLGLLAAAGGDSEQARVHLRPRGCKWDFRR